VESDGLFYLIHGDVTYTDAALKENRLSVVFEDLDAAKESLLKVRTFIKSNPTVYLSTHTPESLDHLDKKTVMQLS
jgi:glyoxylase-like metal-dependent hydrolase (beta-lactamase superfamily II)